MTNTGNLPAEAAPTANAMRRALRRAREGVALDVTEAAVLLRARGARASLEIVGHTDADGDERANDPLSRARAGVVGDMIGASRLDAMDVSYTGLGSTSPLTPGTSDADKQRNRRVVFRVTLPDATGPGSGQP